MTNYFIIRYLLQKTTILCLSLQNQNEVCLLLYFLFYFIYLFEVLYYFQFRGRFKNTSRINRKIYETCVYARRESHRRSVRMRESRDACAASILGGCGFSSSFSVWDMKRGRRERQRGRISWYLWNAIAAKLKTQTFLCCTGLNVGSRLPYIFLVWPFKVMG